MPALYGTARRLAGDADQGADLVQETYLRAFRTFHNFRAGTNCKAWLFTILYSVFINWRKRSRREAASFPTEELEERFARLAEEPADLVGAASEVAAGSPEWSGEVESALHALPESFRAVVLLVDVQELSYEEAAAALNCPVGTVQSRLFRARRLLASALRDHARRSGFVKGGDA
jgi:RNA polymerase sigma-70 factor (ECF subfamily)